MNDNPRMKRQIAGTIILLAIVVAITVAYFKQLRANGGTTVQLMQAIPNTAALVFEFDNDKGFYDLFAGNPVFDAVVGKSKIESLNALCNNVLQHPSLKPFFDQQHVFLSVHGQKGDSVNFLITVAAKQTPKGDLSDLLTGLNNRTLSTKKSTANGVDFYDIYLISLKKHFYVADAGQHILSGSFSKELVQQSAAWKPQKDSQDFVLIPDKQNHNSLANLYVNYAQLTPLFDQLFDEPNTGIFRSFRMMPAMATLTLNYKTDALMFNGYSNLAPKASSYLTLFKDQQPVNTHLADVYPSTTAYATAFAVSNPKHFIGSLTDFQQKAGIGQEEDDAYTKIKNETGVQINTEFHALMGNEFGVVVTRYDERYGIIMMKDGSALRPLLVNISNMVTDDIGQFKYEKLPFYLLGDVFSLLKRPYFMILNNYLILANSEKELHSYKDSYENQKLITKTQAYNEFDSHLPERSNVAFFLQFKNIFPILKRDLKSAFKDDVDPDQKKWGQFYGLSYQLSATEGNFYTNFYMRLSKVDTTGTDN